MKNLNSQDVIIVKEVLHDNFATRTQCELIYDGYFWVGNKALCNRLDSFVTSYQLSILRKFFTDELLIGRIVNALN